WCHRARQSDTAQLKPSIEAGRLRTAGLFIVGPEASAWRCMRAQAVLRTVLHLLHFPATEDAMTYMRFEASGRDEADVSEATLRLPDGREIRVSGSTVEAVLSLIDAMRPGRA